MMLEKPVEERLKKLHDHGFRVLKLRTPGTNGIMDRMIFWPKYAPHPPTFVEIKRPGKEPRPLQYAMADDMRARGCDVREYCDTYEKVDALVAQLLKEAGHANSSTVD